MSYAERFNDAEAERDFLAEEREEKAYAVVSGAWSSGWFSATEIDEAVEDGRLTPAFALKLDEMLEQFKSENRGRWTDAAWALKSVFEAYLELDADVLVEGRKLRQRTPHQLKWNGNRCETCGGRVNVPAHFARRAP
jgi:hypothetical protein